MQAAGGAAEALSRHGASPPAAGRGAPPGGPCCSGAQQAGRPAAASSQQHGRPPATHQDPPEPGPCSCKSCTQLSWHVNGIHQASLTTEFALKKDGTFDKEGGLISELVHACCTVEQSTVQALCCLLQSGCCFSLQTVLETWTSATWSQPAEEADGLIRLTSVA